MNSINYEIFYKQSKFFLISLVITKNIIDIIICYLLNFA